MQHVVSSVVLLNQDQLDIQLCVSRSKRGRIAHVGIDLLVFGKKRERDRECIVVLLFEVFIYIYTQ